MSYKKLAIWQLSKELVIDIHKMTLNNLPKFEMFKWVIKLEDLRSQQGQILSKDTEEEGINKNL